MKFSVLIPVYNVEKYIEQCLDSVISQNYSDYEVVIVDDGSTDTSGEICDRYCKKHPDLMRIIHKENGGLVSARRVGIKEAKGDFCIFVDSDDYVKEECLSTLDRYTDNDIIIYNYYEDCAGKLNDSSDKRLVFEHEQVFVGDEKKKIYSFLIDNDLLHALWIKCIKTELLKNDDTDYNKYNMISLSEDLLQSLYPLTYANRIIYIKNSLYVYRNNRSSMTKSLSGGLERKNSVPVFYMMKEYLSKWGMNDNRNYMLLCRKWLSEAFRMAIRLYKTYDSANDRNIIDQCNWQAFIPEEAIETIKNNAYITKEERGFWKTCSNKKSVNKYIERMLFKRKLDKKVRNIKSFFVR